LLYLGGTVGEKSPWRPLIITSSLIVSIVVFTLLLKSVTSLFVIPDSVWKSISAVLILFFGLTMVFPSVWSKLAFKLKFYKSESLLSKSSNKKGNVGAIFLGASLGPVFTTCSPTYSFLLAIILPQNFGIGVLNLIVFSLGLSIPLLIIGYGGQKMSQKFKFAANPNSWFKKGLVVLLLITALFIFTGFDKIIESYLLKSGYLGPIAIEQSLLKNVK